MSNYLYEDGYTQNRELSWLRFNSRVLDEAKDSSVPLLERLKFVAIHMSNLDEFFAVRCGSLFEMRKLKPKDIDAKSGYSAKEQLDLIYREARKQYERRTHIYRTIRSDMTAAGVKDLKISECTKEEQKYLKRYFQAVIAPLINAEIVDSRHPMPMLKPGAVYAACMLKHKNKEAFAFARVPQNISDVIGLPTAQDGIRFVHTEDVVLEYLPTLFKGDTVSERLKFYITRSADVDADDEMFDDTTDYREKMLKVLKERRHMEVLRLDVSKKPSARMYRFLADTMKLDSSELFETALPMCMKYAFSISGMLDNARKQELTYQPYTPKLTPAFDYSKSLFDQVLKQDVLLSYPFDSMDPFLLLIRQAASDPDVTSIKITIYRMARKSHLVDYLSQAAENGKDVDVLIELKARFDEQNNIDYSERLEDAGCTVMYGFEDYKVHSKICLITRMHGKKPQHVALIATGNFNENTARQYTDLAYITARAGIVRDAAAFFSNMMLGRLDGSYRSLLVAPVSMKPRLLELIKREQTKGVKGRIVIKINSITDEDLIHALGEASKAGTKIDLIVRGICCILPEVNGKTDHVHVRSIVGRYLEHSRIYLFGIGSQERLFISSADFMTRNTERRVEIAVPILDLSIRNDIHAYLDCYFKDNSKARRMKSDGRYVRIDDGKAPFNAQDELMRTAKSSTEQIPLPQRRRSISAFKTVYHEDPSPKMAKQNQPEKKPKQNQPAKSAKKAVQKMPSK